MGDCDAQTEHSSPMAKRPLRSPILSLFKYVGPVLELVPRAVGRFPKAREHFYMGKVSSAPQSRQNQIRIEFPVAIPGVSIGLITALVLLLLCAGCAGISSKTPSQLPTAQTLQITTGVLANAQAGIQLHASITATGGLPPYLWSVASGTLPSGISLDAASGMLSGKPSLGGQFNFSVMLSDSSSPRPQTAMKALTLAVLAFTLQITPGSLPNGQVGVPFQATMTGDGGVTPYTWAVTGALPAGLSLTASSGGIAGTPTQAGSYAFTIVLTDSMGQTAQKASSITIVAAGSTGSGPVVITPSTPPAVNQGGTFQFTANAPVTWSMAAGSQGTIDADGTYHAPASVKAQQSYGGYQVLPNNHIFNTRVDSLPVNSNSAAWIAGAGTVPVNYFPSVPINYVDSLTPVQNMVFKYTPGNSGSFEIPQYPFARIQNGWFDPPFGGDDRHLFAIDIGTGMFQELYNYYSAGANTLQSCPACTSQSGLRYPSSAYDLPANGSTDAGGLLELPLALRLQELGRALATGGTINHVLAFTLPNGYIHNSFVWPATANANAGGGVNPYGARFRLRAGFDISKFSPIARILLTQLKQYGIILSDGGYSWQIGVEYTDWPASYLAAFGEIRAAGIRAPNFEAVDESGLMVSPSSGNTNVGGETVIATSASDPTKKAQMAVVLTGVTVNLPKDAIYFQAGAGQQQLIAYVNGSSATGVTWSMNPPLGTLTTGGGFTAPAAQVSPATTTVTATSSADPSVAASMQVTVLPNGPVRLYSCDGCSNSYTDTTGKIWHPMTGDDGGYPYDNGGSWPTTPDITLYKVPYYALGSGGQDIRFDIYVSNGNYKITAKESETNDCAAGKEFTGFESQGTLFYDQVDIFSAAGGCNQPKDFVLTASVTNGLLSFVVRRESSSYNHISALEIDPSQ
jgi:hypothetical protein